MIAPNELRMDRNKELKEFIENIIKDKIDIHYNKDEGVLSLSIYDAPEEIMRYIVSEWMPANTPTFKEVIKASDDLEEEYNKQLPSETGNYGCAFERGVEWAVDRLLGDGSYSWIIDNNYK